MNNIANQSVDQSGEGKQSRSFQTSGKNNNNISDLCVHKYKCGKEKCLSVFITGF